MEKIPVEDIEWKIVNYLRQGQTLSYDYQLILNKPLADWDVYDYWERERVESMRQHLIKGDVLFDIGTEQGWCDLVYAHIVGPDNMVLVEPTPEFWPNIKALWMKNFDVMEMPRACFPGFFSDKTVEKGYGAVYHRHFPLESEGDLIDRNSYKNLSDPSHTDIVPQITLDDFVKQSGVIPTALTIDVEGAELLVLRGAEKTLRDHRLKVWVSEHDDLAENGYSIKPGEVATFMQSLGYKREVLAKDHECHVYYSK